MWFTPIQESVDTNSKRRSQRQVARPGSVHHKSTRAAAILPTSTIMTSASDLQIVIPVHNDWDAVQLLLPHIGEQLEMARVMADVLLVDDGSVTPPPPKWGPTTEHLRNLRILTLHKNLGHQRAICIALSYLRSESNCRLVLVMDGDGEDSPADIPRLLTELRNNGEARIVFAERTKRSEGWFFTFFYLLYRWLHRCLVGHRVRVGNFSAMNRECLESLCTSSELWNHFAASVFATRQPMSLVATNRAKRLAGESRMNFPALVMHGLSALSVFSDRISTRLLILSSLLALLTVSGMVLVTLVRLTTGCAIPGWATSAFGILAILLVQIGTFMLTFSFLVLITRGFSQFIPVRDYHHFVRRVDEVQHDVGA